MKSQSTSPILHLMMTVFLLCGATRSTAQIPQDMHVPISQMLGGGELSLSYTTSLLCNGHWGVDLTVNGGVPPYQYTWSNAEGYFSSEEDVEILYGRQDISVVVYDQLGNYAVTDVDLGIPAVITNTPCSGPPSGSIDITLPSNFVNPEFQWWGNHELIATTEDVYDLDAGKYLLYVYQSVPSQCWFLLWFTVSSLPSITGEATVTPSGWSCEAGAIDLTPSGGTPPYSFEWSEGQTTEDLEGLESGFYSVIITDASGCHGELSNIFVPNAPLMQISGIATPTPDCDAAGAIDIAVTGGVPPYSYYWFPSQSTDEDPTGLHAGGHIVTVTDATGCTAVEEFTISAEESTLSISGDFTLPCFGGHNGSIDLTVSGGVPPYTYDWHGPGGFSAITEDIEDLRAGNYSCYVTDASGCVEIYTLILLNGPQVLELTADITPTCTDRGAINLTVDGTNGPFTFDWNNSEGPTTEDITNLPLNSENSVLVTDVTLGCTATGIFMIPSVSPEDMPKIIDHTIDQDCDGADVSVSAIVHYEPATYDWVGAIGDNSSNSPNLVNVGSGVYRFKVWDAAGCYGQQNIIVPPGPALGLDFWSGAPCSSTLKVIVTGGIGPFTYDWSNGATTDMFQGAAPSEVYSVTVQDQNGMQCSASASFETPEIEPLNIVLDEIVYACDGDHRGVIRFNVTGLPDIIDGLIFSWSGPPGGILGPNGVDLINLGPGAYTLSITGVCGPWWGGTYVIQDLSPSTLYLTPTPACGLEPTGSIHVGINGGIPPFSYEWIGPDGFTSTMQDPTGLAAGTYTVTVSSAPPGSCQSTASCIVGSVPKLVLNAVVTPSCGTNGSIDLTWVGGHQAGWRGFLWEGPEGFSSTSKDIFGLVPGTYTVTVSDGVSCQITESYTVEAVEIQLSPIVTDVACSSGSLGAIDITPSGGAEPYTFSWSNGASTEDISDLQEGAYTVLIQDANGCSLEQTFYVHDAAPCCTADIIIPDGAYSSQYATPLNTLFSNTSLKILGTFHVDNSCFIFNCTVYMEAGAQIIQEPGANLVIRNSQMEDCNGVMWRGITVGDGSYLEIQQSTVRDAENAVTALNGATIYHFDNDFTDNRVSLNIPVVPGGPMNSVSMYVIGNRYTGTGTLAQPYPGQTTALGSVGYAAVVAYRSSLDLTGHAGYSNTVDNLSNGILAYDSDLRVTRFDFKNVQPDAAYDLVANGSGIYAFGRNGDHHIRQTGNGMQGPPSFLNCKWGIYTVAMNTNSRDNYMQAVGTGYRVDKARAYNQINNNRIKALQNGMELRQNAGTLSFLVQGNDITFGTLATLTPAPLSSGILVADGNQGGWNSRIEGNTITMLDYPLATTGITLYPARSWVVAGNTINMENNSYNQYGIANYGSFKLEVSCNQVQGAQGAFGPGQAAIYSNMGDNLLFSCNDMDRTANGMLFNGAASYVDVQGNKIHRHKYGLHLSTNAIIGGQDRTGNLWYNQPATGGLGAWYEMTGPLDPNPAQNPFTYNPALIEGGNTEPPSWEPDEWFDFDSGNNYECSPVGADSYCGQFQMALADGGLTELDGLVARDSLRNDPYTAETRWMLKEGLYRKLDDDPDLLTGRPDMAAFYADMQGTATAAFKLIDDGRPVLFAMDSTVTAQLQANADQIAALMDSVKVRMDQLQDSTLTPAQTAAVLASLGGFRQSMQTLAAWNSTAMQVARDSKVLTAEGLKTANSNIAATELIEANRKTVEEIYLGTIGKEIDTFTVAQANELFAIANQCPMVGGNSVYTARSLYRLIDDEQEYDDQLLCLPHGIIVKRLAAMEVNGISVQPNPARDNATLVLEVSLEETGMLVLYNLAGQELLRVDVPAGEPRTEFYTGILATGLYQYRVETGGTLLGHGKLAIVR